MARASARHILVPSAEQAEQIKLQIAEGADFAEMARQNSTCPSGAAAATWASSLQDRWSRSSTTSASMRKSASSTDRSRRSSAIT